jgi:hypothetical protein
VLPVLDPARLARLNLWVPGVVAAVGIGVMAVRYAHDVLGLNAELSFPAYFSTFVLACSALATVQLGRTYPSVLDRRTVVLLGLLQLFLAADELLTFHEHLEALLGVDWQTLYLPVGVIGLVIGLRVLAMVRHHSVALGLYLLGGAMWAVSQGMEKWPFGGDELVHPWSIYPEELLEVTGSAVLGFAALLVLRARVAAPPEHRVAERDNSARGR